MLERTTTIRLRHLVQSIALVALAASTSRAVDPGSQLVGCDQADTRVTVAVSSHLDPSCTWTRGIEIVASDVVLDCQGAHIVGPDRRTGILVTAPTDVALSNVVVRNCHVEGFLNDVRVTREDFRDLAAGAEYEHAFSNVVIEDSTLLDSRGVGVFVDGYVTGVTLRRLHIEGSGSAGIYLEGGSKDNVVEDNDVVGNGYVENGPNGQFFDFGGLTIWFWGTGREGLAIDGSRNNRVTGNRFSGNSAGGIFLYKNCGEFVNQRPDRWFERRYGADGNSIEGNTFVGEKIGVWIGSRMGENTLPMDCSDPAYYASGLTRVVLDYARDAVVRGNRFENVTYGVRVEDDRAVVADNEFSGDHAGDQAIVVGTPWRTSALGRPVDATTITGNRATIAGSKNPYRWNHGHTATVFTGNESSGRVVGFCEGEPPPRNVFIFVVALVQADPANPPTDPPPVVPPPDPLPPCPIACAAGSPVERPRVAVRRLATPPGDDRLVFEGRVTLPSPLDPPLDPVEAGIGLVIIDETGRRLVDVTVPGGAFDPTTQVGWKASPARGVWRWVNRGDAPPGGIVGIAIRDLSKKIPGRVRFAVDGRRGAYPVDAAALPLAAILSLDPPTAETGQCGNAAFPACIAGADAVTCR